MNTSHLEKFAQEARKKLLEQVGAKLNFVLTTDSAELREKTEQLKQLRQELNRTAKEQLIEKVAYTWFNRLMALRFMDVNDYQPLGIRIITPKDGYTIPELLDEAKRGNIPEALKVQRQKVYDLLDNKIPSTNPQNEAYKELLIAACNHLNTVFPFLFERINDYTELLLPDDLTSDFSIVKDIRDGMIIEDCKNVEIIGWLYQFYISEENDRLIKEKKPYKKHELAPASQLFTPRWIVQYMVDNTLGQLLSELYPNTRILQNLEFYIKPSYISQLHPRDKKKLEDIKLFDPCVGSAHILVYAFDVLYLIYKEQGYNEVEIPELIIMNNLYGTDIDERATQLSSFALMMKGRQYYRRFLRREIRPNIGCFIDFEFDNKFKNASTIGSLTRVETEAIDRIVIDEGSIFSSQQKELKRLYKFLAQEYDIVVTNPPYISSSRMEGTLKQYVEKNYQETKSDLFATFILRCLEFCSEDGLTGYMSPFVWMFISSYDKLRQTIINKHMINNLIQLEYSGFDGATVPICTFTLRKRIIPNAEGSYIRLTDFKGSKLQAPKTLEAIRNPECGWFYNANQKDFEKIPSSPIGYWVGYEGIQSFINFPTLGEESEVRTGLDSGNNLAFVRDWFEVSKVKSSIETYDRHKKLKWYPYNNGGGYRKWYGNNYLLINWSDNGIDIHNYNNVPMDYNGAPVRAKRYYFRNGITYGKISSKGFTTRIVEEGFIFSSGGSMIFSKHPLINILAITCSKVAQFYLNVFNPTLNNQVGDVLRLPIKYKLDENIIDLAESSVLISKLDWDSRETSWNFKENELLRNKTFEIEEAYELYQQFWKNKFFQLHRNEEKLNFLLIRIYGLNNEITPEVLLEDVTILQDELDRKELERLNNYLTRDSENSDVKNYLEIKLPFNSKEIIAQFLSYSVGCMFGRFSLDKRGLILANQGETLQDYINTIGKSFNNCSFLPDEDNIVPVLDDEWFDDDIIGRFYKFLRITFGEENFNKNLAYIEEQIGKDIRKYFIKDFYVDHIKRYQKRPIYWMFSSPKGSFNVLIYMHRYTPDTVSNILNKYLKEFIGKLNTRKQHLERIKETGSASDKSKALKESDNIQKMLVELHEYERDILYPLATERIEIDLDDGVLVNYNKFGKAVKEVNGLNDPATKKKVKQFDWIDTAQIR